MTTPHESQTMTTPPPTAASSDTILLRRWVEERDEDAIRLLVQHYAPLVHSTCRRYLGDGADADEAAQATFIALSRQADAVRDPRLLPGWLHRTALRACARVRRSAQRRRRIEQAAAQCAAASTAGTEADWSQARPFLDQALDTIPTADRTALLAYIVDGVPQGDLAQREGVSREALKKRIQRSLARLEVWYQQRGITTPAAALIDGATHDLADSHPGVERCLDALAHPAEVSRQARSLAASLEDRPAAGQGQGTVLATGTATVVVIAMAVVLAAQVEPLLQLAGKAGPSPFAEVFMRAFVPLAILIPLFAVVEAVTWWRTRECHWAPLYLLAQSTITTCAVTYLAFITRAPEGLGGLACLQVSGVSITLPVLLVPVVLLGAALAGAAWVMERMRNRKPIPRAMTVIRCVLLAALLAHGWFGCLRLLFA